MNLSRRIADWPAMSAAAVSGGEASPGGTPQVMPLAEVSTHAAGDYATIAYGMRRPLWTTDGAAVPAAGPMRWGQLAEAGRP